LLDDEITGHSLIRGTSTPGAGGELFGVNPATGERLDGTFTALTTEQLADATQAAAEAFAEFSELEPERHAAFLELVATNLEARRDRAIARARLETGLGEPRLQGEVTRTVNQLRLFADVVRRGDHRGVRIDPAQPDRTPMPRVDLRQLKLSLGPVAVFGSSNFPFAYSVAGGDVASALAAGCPVVVKAHPAHPGTSELVGHAIVDAVREAGLHPGTFGLVFGLGNDFGQSLVADPNIRAVGFTGSAGGGFALMSVAARRPDPIPVYAEMSGTNPVFLYPGACAADDGALAEGLVACVTGSAGQLCTVPGLVFVPRGVDGDRVVSEASARMRAETGQTMLHAGIAANYRAGLERLASTPGVRVLSTGTDGAGPNAPAPRLFETDLEQFLATPSMQVEVFGAATLCIRYDRVDELPRVAAAIGGQLTATLWLNEADRALAPAMIRALPHRVGRVVVNGWPTSVEVGHAVVHGGPSPATSDARMTSVGTLAIDRFLRPVAFQDVPAELLPAAVQDANPWSLRRRIDGVTE
jgi:NADP-dependent aldehyde dehydrogenase